MNTPSSSRSSQQGVVLLEAMIAILIFSVGVLAIVGLQAAMIKNTSESKYRADASYIAQQRIGAMWADPDNADSFVEANTDISTLLPGGTRTIVKQATGRYLVTIAWQLPGQTAHNLVVVANVVGG